MNNQKLCGVLLALFLIAPSASSWGQASDAGRYFERGEEGWFWYEPEPESAPEPTIDDTPLEVEPVPKPGSVDKSVVEEIDPVDSKPLSAAWFRARYRDYDGVWRDRVFDNRVLFSVQGGFKPSRKWEASLRWSYAGGTPYTPFDIEQSSSSDSDWFGVLDATRVNSTRNPPYHTLSLRVDRRFDLPSVSVTSFASCIRASSCSPLIPRHPAVTGVPLVRERAGASFATPSLKTNRTVSSIPRRPVPNPRARSPPATRA